MTDTVTLARLTSPPIADTRPGIAEPVRVPARGVWLRGGTRPLVALADVNALVLSAIIVDSAPWADLIFAAALMVLNAGGGLYRSRLVMSLLDDLPRLAGRGLAALAVTLVLATLASRMWPGLDIAQPTLSMASFALWSTCLLLLGRAVSYAVVRHLRATRVVAHRTLIVGAGQIGREVADALTQHPEYGLAPIGFLDSTRRHYQPLGLPVLGDTNALTTSLDIPDLRAVVLAYGRLPETELVQLIRTCHRRRYEVFVVPRLYELQHVAEDMEYVWGTPLVRLRRAAYRGVPWRCKRLLDIVVSAAVLLVLSPIMLLVAAAVRLEGGPGVIFRQERVGCDGRRFSLMKFRSMRPANEAQSATQWSIADDERVGRVGRLLRVSSLDELPQLINILRGEMSLVGPRPERPHFVEEFQRRYPSYMARHRVPCGLTGWAQVHGLRGDTSIEDRARFDNFYIENWSLWLDLKILLLTAVSLVTAPGS